MEARGRQSGQSDDSCVFHRCPFSVVEVSLQAPLRRIWRRSDPWFVPGGACIVELRTSESSSQSRHSSLARAFLEGNPVKITIFGATGSLGGHCLEQCLAADHEVTVLVRDRAKLAEKFVPRMTILEGDALDSASVDAALSEGTEAVLFAIGVDKRSPEDLCTDVTRNILDSMRRHQVRRLVWCGGGSTLVADDQVSFGARFVEAFTKVFMGLRHRDKEHQLALLEESRDIEWVGLRPLQMNRGEAKPYRVGFHAFSGFSAIHFTDCAREMIRQLEGDTWLHKAPIIQY